MRRNSIFTKRWVKGSAVLVATAATLVFASPQQAVATPLKGVESATVSQSASNVVDIDFAGGIKGRKIELIVRDDGQNAEQAKRAARELIDLRPEVVIGPVTSSMAAVVVPMMNEAQLTLISPTVMSPDFHGKDDRFFRVNRTTTEAGLRWMGPSAR